MAIDYGISSLDTGASDITYSGDEGPKSPDQQLMASADPMLVEEYKKYVFEMEEQGQTPISFKQFIQQIMSESRMAEGGIARLGYDRGGRIGFEEGGWDDRVSSAAEDFGSTDTAKDFADLGSGGGGQDHPWEDDMGTVGTGEYTPPTEDQREEVAKTIAKESKKYKKSVKESRSSKWRKLTLKNWIDQKYGNKPKIGGFTSIGNIFNPSFKSEEDYFPTDPDEYFEGVDYGMTGEDLTDIKRMKTGLKEYEGQHMPQDVWEKLAYGPDGPPVLGSGDGPGETEYERWLRLQGQQPAAPVDVVPDTTDNWNVASSSPLYDRSGPTHDFSGEWFYGADGGRIPAAYGGIMGDDGRRAYGLGSFFKSITKPFKSAARAVKKVAKSPIGKAALMAGLGMYAGGLGPWAQGGMWQGAKGAGFLKNMAINKSLLGTSDYQGGSTGLMGGLWNWAKKNPELAIGGLSALGGLYTKMTEGDDEDEEYKKWLDKKNYWASRFGGDWNVTPGDPLYQRGLMAQGGRAGYRFGNSVDNMGIEDIGLEQQVKMREDIGLEQQVKMRMEVFNEDYDTALQKVLEARGESTDSIISGTNVMEPSDLGMNIIRDQGVTPRFASRPNKMIPFANKMMPVSDKINEGGDFKPGYSPHYSTHADGGRIGYQGGYMVDDDEEEEKHRTAALKAMYKRMGAQEGGLMDMGGMEKDYRNDGGFVPIGGQERADDVPARLSKNEFVFTADAVRAAGGGDIDKGAEVMENVMENLEEGGEISQQSQGLEGARNMFATSQRLEGVL